VWCGSPASAGPAPPASQEGLSARHVAEGHIQLVGFGEATQSRRIVLPLFLPTTSTKSEA